MPDASVHGEDEVAEHIARARQSMQEHELTGEFDWSGLYWMHAGVGQATNNSFPEGAPRDLAGGHAGIDAPGFVRRVYRRMTTRAESK